MEDMKRINGMATALSLSHVVFPMESLINLGVYLDTFFVRPECRAWRGVSKGERKTLGTNGI